MNMTNKPPAYVVSKSKELNADPLFVHRVCVAAAMYFDSRTTEIELPQTRKKLRKPHQDMVAAARNYLHAAGALGIESKSADIRAVRARIEASEDVIETIDRLKGHFDSNQTLISLCGRLLHIFENFNIGNHKLATFVSDIIDHISPLKDKGNEPGIEAIRKAVTKAKKENRLLPDWN